MRNLELPHPKALLYVIHQGGSSLIKTFKFDFGNYSEKFKPCYLPVQETICSGDSYNSKKMDWDNIQVIMLPILLRRMVRRLIMKGWGRRPVLPGLSQSLRCWISRRRQNRFGMTFRKAGVIIWKRKACLFFSKVYSLSSNH